MSPNTNDAGKSPAIIVGMDNAIGVHVARTMARHKVPVIAIAKDPKSFGVKTKACQQIHYADTSNEEVIEKLEELGPQLPREAVLFPCTDRTVLVISRHRQRLEKWYKIILPAAEVVELLMDKVSFYNFAQTNGFPIPKTVITDQHTDIQEVARQMAYPCTLKPPNSKDPRWLKHTHMKALKVHTAEELCTQYQHYKDWADQLIVQEWIEGEDDHLFSCNCYFGSDSEPIATFIARKLRQYPPQVGESCLGEECRNEFILEETIRLFKSVNYRGLGYVEAKRDRRTGNYYIVEPNIGRPTGRSAIVEGGGVEILYSMYCDALGLPLTGNTEQKYQGTKWVHLRKDFLSALAYWRQGELSLKEWWQSLRGKKVYALFSWSDPGPFVADLIRIARLGLSVSERNKRSRPAVTHKSHQHA